MGANKPDSLISVSSEHVDRGLFIKPLLLFVLFVCLFVCLFVSFFLSFFLSFFHGHFLALWYPFSGQICNIFSMADNEIWQLKQNHKHWTQQQQIVKESKYYWLANNFRGGLWIQQSVKHVQNEPGQKGKTDNLHYPTAKLST